MQDEKPTQENEMNRTSHQQALLNATANLMATIHLGQAPEKVSLYLKHLGTTLTRLQDLKASGDLTDIMAELDFATKVHEASLDYIAAVEAREAA